VGATIPASVVALSRALREARSDAGLTQRAAADKNGVHIVTLYTWESEQQGAQPNDKNLAKAAKIYHTTSEAIRSRATELESQAASGGLEPLPETRGRRVRPLPRSRAAKSAPTTVTAEVVSAEGAIPMALRAVADADSDAEVPLPGVSRRVYGRVYRALADLADETDLSPQQLAGVQKALTSPALIGVFTTLSSQPNAEDALLAAVDAAAVAVRTFDTGRQGKR
jgi:transcriptional regulator with XRE-family HTH domain